MYIPVFILIFGKNGLYRHFSFFFTNGDKNSNISKYETAILQSGQFYICTKCFSFAISFLNVASRDSQTCARSQLKIEQHDVIELVLSKRNSADFM